MHRRRTGQPTIHRRWFHPDLAGQSRRIPLVLLHEGLGSISAWGPFPQALADATRRSVLAYDRAGYGSSDPRLGPWPAKFLHVGAVELRDLLVEEGLGPVILVGHSDGASISLLYPSQAGSDDPEIVGIVSLSAHVMVEEVNVEAIGELRRTYHEVLAPRLERHHRNADRLFDDWSEVWVSERFRGWAIDAELGSITCAVLAVQGAADGYGTALQLERLTAAVSCPVEVIELEGVDHWPHKEAPDEVLRLVTRFADQIDPSRLSP